jgi:hypothetical protein
VHAPHSRMSAHDYTIELKVECPDGDANEAAFIRATTTIGGHDIVEEFLACKMYPLASSFGFRSVTIGMTPMSMVWTPLPLFPIEVVSMETADRVLVEFEMETKKILGCFRPKEHDALKTAKLWNGGRLNRMFE